VRTRPFLDNEREKNGEFSSCIKVGRDNKHISLVRHDRKDERDNKPFGYDQVLDVDSTQDQAYESLALPVVQDILNGYNGVIMAYG